MNIEQLLRDMIREIVKEELDKRFPEMLPVEEFCRKHNISRGTVRRAEKEGKIKVIRIGKKVFVPIDQFQFMNKKAI